MWDHGNVFCMPLVRPDISPHKHLGIWRNPRCTPMGFHRMLWNTSRLFWISIKTHENLFNRTACEVTPIRLDKTQFSLLFPLGFYRRLWNTSLLFWISIKTHQNLFNRMIYEITPTSLDETQFLSSFFPAVRQWMYQAGTFNKKDLSNEDLVLLLWKNFRVPQYLPVVWRGLWMHFQFFSRGVTITFLPHRFKSAIWNSILLSKISVSNLFHLQIHMNSQYFKLHWNILILQALFKIWNKVAILSRHEKHLPEKFLFRLSKRKVQIDVFFNFLYSWGEVILLSLKKNQP